MSDDLDFSINKDKDIDSKVDKAVKIKLDKPVESRIRFAHNIKKNPPKPGFMKVDVTPAIYSIDLNTDANWWFNHSCTVFPFLLDQGIRTHVDIKDSFKTEKRKLDFQYWWVIVLLITVPIVLLITNMFFKIF